MKSELAASRGAVAGSGAPTIADLRARYRDMTIAQALVDRAERTPDQVALRVKDKGIYREITWLQYRDMAEECALGLSGLGVERGDRIAIMGDPCLEWIVSDMAILSLGAISLGIYSTSSVDEVEYQINKTGAKVLVAENQEYVDKIMAVIDRCPSLRRIVVADTRAMFLYDDERILTWNEVCARGREVASTRSGFWMQSVRQGKADDVCLLVFTSGTTAQSKAAMITHRTFLLGGAVPFVEAFPHILESEERIIVHLALAHAFERIYSLYTPLVSGAIINVGEDLESLKETLYEVQPTFFHGVPRIWQKMAGQVLTGVASSGWIKRRTFDAAMSVGHRYIERRWTGEAGIGLRFLYWVARQIAFRPILRKLGLSKSRHALTAGTHMPFAVQRLWQVWGLNLLNALGMTEVGYVAFQRSEYQRPGDVGKPVDGLEIRVAEDGELLYRGYGVFKGYWDEPDATAEAIDADGWFHSGDIGRFTEPGDLELIDRKKDIVITAGGKNLSPALIEGLVKASPYVSECVLVAEGRKFPSALIEIDFDTVAEWARENGILYGGYTSLAGNEQVYKLINGAVEDANAHLSRVEQIKKFCIIPKELDPEEGDTTATRKIKRKHFEKMFEDLINGMYDDDADIGVLLREYR